MKKSFNFLSKYCEVDISRNKHENEDELCHKEFYLDEDSTLF